MASFCFSALTFLSRCQRQSLTTISTQKAVRQVIVTQSSRDIDVPLCVYSQGASNESLDELIARKEQQLRSAEADMNAWGQGANKNASPVAMSKIYVESLRQELAKLYLKRSEGVD